MTITTEAHFPCPSCGGPAHTTINWEYEGDGDPARAAITRYSCPNDCQVDHQALRHLVGVKERGQAAHGNSGASTP